MQHKCDAWRKEAEKLGPLRDKIFQLHQEKVRLQTELDKTSELVRQLKGKRKAERKSAKVTACLQLLHEYSRHTERDTTQHKT